MTRAPFCIILVRACTECKSQVFKWHRRTRQIRSDPVITVTVSAAVAERKSKSSNPSYRWVEFFPIVRHGWEEIATT
uniref:Uncharacterized protein n=1 Tax=Anopheles aquasalis TaxID=42839 RepID=T1DHN8_ANOAQ